ncbi:MAG: sigma-70 family RNA polymerase sigma factor [Ruminococcus sp.]|nr:sigma-70 family RNA polymerase sigma factor [Ruminococcus sp.]
METDFRTAVESNKDIVYKIAFAGCGNTADAEDIFQDVFMKLLESGKKFESGDHLRHWLIRVTVNQVKMHRRRAKYRKTVILDGTEAYDSSDVCDTAENKLIRSAVLELPEKYRIIVLLYYYEDRSVKEIGRILRLNEQTVKTRLHRARLLLKDELKEDWSND